jgi:Fe-S cluster assembly protein SufD
MSGAGAGTASWLAPLREAARARFARVGLPKPSDEEWRQTNVLPLGAFAETVAGPASIGRSAFDALPLASAIDVRAVLVNGRLDPALSTLSALPAGVAVAGLAGAAGRMADRLAPVVGRISAREDTPFAALNTASFVDGVVVAVDAGIEVAPAIHVVHVARPEPAPRAIHPRTVVLAARRSRVTIVESFVGVGEGRYLTNAVTEIDAGDDAHVTHVKIQSETPDGWHIASISGRQGRGATIVSHNVSLGAALSRNDIGSRLDGPGAECKLYGLYIADGTQHVDNHTWLDHAQPHCPSWEMYKGLLAGRARAVFNGRIVVREGAQKTDAKQSNRNLILGDGALVYTRPQLEIYANDVKCTHGATIGRLDEESLFYLRTRGLPATEARNLLIRAFAGDLIDQIPVAGIRAVLGDALDARLMAVA